MPKWSFWLLNIIKSKNLFIYLNLYFKWKYKKLYYNNINLKPYNSYKYKYDIKQHAGIAHGGKYQEEMLKKNFLKNRICAGIEYGGNCIKK